jgi:hypothetical protein
MPNGPLSRMPHMNNTILRPSVERQTGAASALDGAATRLCLEPTFLAGLRGTGLHALPLGERCPFNQCLESRASILTIEFLRPKAVGPNDKHAIARQAPPGELRQPNTDDIRQACGPRHVKAQLHRSRNFVDVLSAWA